MTKIKVLWPAEGEGFVTLLSLKNKFIIFGLSIYSSFLGFGQNLYKKSLDFAIDVFN